MYRVLGVAGGITAALAVIALITGTWMVLAASRPPTWLIMICAPILIGGILFGELVGNAIVRPPRSEDEALLVLYLHWFSSGDDEPLLCLANQRSRVRQLLIKLSVQQIDAKLARIASEALMQVSPNPATGN